MTMTDAGRANDLRQATLTVNAKADAVGALLDNGYLRLYGGLRPASADDSVTTQVLLAELRFSTPAFRPAEGGIIEAFELTQETAARATGTATWFRAVRADGLTAVQDGSIAVPDAPGGATMVINNPEIQVNTVVAVSTFVHRETG